MSNQELWDKGEKVTTCTLNKDGKLIIYPATEIEFYAFCRWWDELVKNQDPIITNCLIKYEI